MIVLIFDTETTHLLSEKTKADCRIIQLAWIMYDTKTNSCEENNFILNSHSEITNSHIHGITTEISAKGYNFEEIIDIFLEDVKNSDIIVGHNLKYDLNALQVELERLDDRFDDINNLFNKPTYDTMREACTKFKLKKYPKLVNLYKMFFGKEFDNAHNALEDVKATLECYKQLTL